MIASILDPVYSVVTSILAAFYQVTHSYAVSIALLTIVIMVLVLPLTLKSTKSMLEMQQLQPEMKRIQQQYTDMQQRNEAMMALYKEHNVSPLGGCVPMLLPLPVFIVMYRVIAGLVRTCSEKLVASAPFAGNTRISTDPTVYATQFCPKHVGSGTELFQSLVGRTKMSSLGLDLAEHTIKTIQNNVVRGIPYILLVLVVTATSYYQQRQVTVRNKNQQAVNPQQQMLLKVMPVVFGGFSLFFPAALIVYWLVQNVFRIGQNGYITRRFYGEGGLGHKAAAAGLAAKELADKAKSDKGKGDPAPSAKGKTPAPRPTRPTKPAASGPKAGAKPAPKPAPKPSASKPETPPANGSGSGKASRPQPSRPKPSRPTPSRPKPNEN